MAHAEAGWNRDAEVFDLGLGGVQVGVSEVLAVGDRVAMSFVAASRWDPLEVRGRVVWVRAGAGLEPVRAGVAFELADGAIALALFELIGSLEFES
jgi:hypothetical protein